MDGCIDRRRASVRVAVFKFRRDGTPGDRTELVANAVCQCPAEIVKQRAGVIGLELINLRVGVEKGVLDEIARVDGVAGPGRDTSVGPPFEAWQIAGKQAVERTGVSGPGSPKQFLRRRVRFDRDG
jgi:hypothetical protein